MSTMNDWDNRFEVPQILMLIERVFNLLQFDVQWDINEEVEGNDWRKMTIDELADKLSEDFKYKLIDEYMTMLESGEWDELKSAEDPDESTTAEELLGGFLELNDED